ncbi:hypothetical protein GOV12_06185 [Candidatus Pacearchaeota archaeon]|nr:hypothetical protein [Candidatus Pacearchaeota archaeon]
MEKKIKMMAASSVALQYLMSHQNSTDEEVMQDVANFIMEENIKDDEIKFAMIAAATETYNIFMNSPKMTEKEYLKIVMENIPKIINNSIDQE